MREQKKQGFSLMEMMVVLLIVAIIAAATAPMVSKKMSRNAGSGDSPWVFTGLNNSIAYNMNEDDNSSVIIGTSRLPNGWNQRARLYIDSGNNAAHIAFGRGNNEPFLLTADPANGRVGFSNDEIPSQSIAFGAEQSISRNNTSGIVAIGHGIEIDVNSPDSVAIGRGVSVSTGTSIAIGDGVQASLGGIAIGGYYTSDSTIAEGSDSIAIGRSAKADNGIGCVAIGCKAYAQIPGGYGASSFGSVAIGKEAEAMGHATIAIGNEAKVENSGSNGIALGTEAIASHSNSVAIGAEAKTRNTNQIVLGTSNHTVYIPGNLVVDGSVSLARNTNSRVYMRAARGGDGKDVRFFEVRHNDDGKLNSNTKSVTNVISDSRLKNIGEKYTAGLAELKQLDFFHYTYKKDEAKTPHVGVMAQDLQKVFPDAVTKGEDGYLRIRFEDMFYAVINAVKELDNKITEIVNNITQINAIDKKQNETIESMQATIDSQQKTIELLQKDNEELKSQKEIIAEQQKLIKKLEKRIEKLES